MIFGPIITALAITLFLTALFSLMFKNGRPWGGVVFFVVLFLIMWAGGLWLHPIEPLFWGTSWIPLLFFGLLIGLLLLAADEDTRSRWSKELDKDKNEKDPTKISGEIQQSAFVISLFFWALIAVLIVAIISGYFIHHY